MCQVCVFSWSRFENSRGISLFNQRCRFLNCIPWRSFFFDKPKALKAPHLPNFSFQTTNLQFSFLTLFYVLLLFPVSSYSPLSYKLKEKKKEIEIPFSQKWLKERGTIKCSIFTFFLLFFNMPKMRFRKFLHSQISNFMTTKNNRKQKCFPILFYAALPCFASLESIQLCSAWLRSVQLGLTWFCFALLCFVLLCFASLCSILLCFVSFYFVLFPSLLYPVLLLLSASHRSAPLCFHPLCSVAFRCEIFCFASTCSPFLYFLLLCLPLFHLVPLHHASNFGSLETNAFSKAKSTKINSKRYPNLFFTFI